MLPEIGHFCLILALALAILQFFFPLYGTWKKEAHLIYSAHKLALGQSFFVISAFLILVICFVNNDFSVRYVAANSNTHLPFFYKITAVWGAHEGSLLLWVTILAFWTLGILFFTSNINNLFRARALAVMGAISIGFLWFLLQTSNPFLRLILSTPIDGNDLNPLLQDPGFIMHPPILYMGYVGTTVGFAFAIAALWSNGFGTAWIRWSLPWVLTSWCFLTLGITLGSWWSYRDLGWGGWWFWDPVENASLMPWLISTALIHSLMVSAKRGVFKNWTIILSILAFVLSLMGTFLVRSGILTSVHAFAVDPSRGLFMLSFVGIVILFSFVLYAWRGQRTGMGGQFTFVSRESLLLTNNLLLFVLMATVCLGTLYPLILQVLNIAKISVGPPYFNAVFVPISAILLFLMGFAPSVHWYNTSWNILIRNLFLPFLISIGISLFFPWIMNHDLPWGLMLGLSLSVWIVLTGFKGLLERVWQLKSFKKISRSFWAMTIAHLGVAISVLGISITCYYSIEKNFLMHLNSVAAIADYQIRLLGFSEEDGDNYQGTSVYFSVLNNNHIIRSEKRFYPVSQAAMSLPGININWWGDLYIALGALHQISGVDTFEVRIYYKPGVRWIWIGGILMALGGLLGIKKRS